MGRLIDVIELKKQIVYSNILNDGITLDDLDQIIDEVPTIEPQRTGKYHDQFGNPIYVYVRVGDKTVTIKADDLQKTLDYVTKHGEEVTIEGRRKAVDTAISALQEQEAKHSTESSSTHKALDTISRQAAIDAIRASTKKYTGFMEMEMYTDDDAVEAIEGLPSVQPELPEDICSECDAWNQYRQKKLPSAQPDIIRCKDCKHHWTHRCMDSMPTEICELGQTFYDANVDFCSLAERRTDDT